MLSTPMSFQRNRLACWIPDFAILDKSSLFVKSNGDFIPPVDVSEDGNEIVVTVDLPGARSEDVSITLSDQEISIKGKIEARPNDREDEKKVKYLLAERTGGEFSRWIGLPVTIDPNSANAKFNNGILQIRAVKASKTGTVDLRIEPN